MTSVAKKDRIDILLQYFESLNPRPASVEFFREEEGGRLLTLALEWAAHEGAWQLVVCKAEGPAEGTPAPRTRRPLVQLPAEQQRVALTAFFELMMLAASEPVAPPPDVTEALAALL